MCLYHWILYQRCKHYKVSTKDCMFLGSELLCDPETQVTDCAVDEVCPACIMFLSRKRMRVVNVPAKDSPHAGRWKAYCPPDPEALRFPDPWEERDLWGVLGALFGDEESPGWEDDEEEEEDDEEEDWEDVDDGETIIFDLNSDLEVVDEDDEDDDGFDFGVVKSFVQHMRRTGPVVEGFPPARGKKVEWGSEGESSGTEAQTDDSSESPGGSDMSGHPECDVGVFSLKHSLSTRSNESTDSEATLAGDAEDQLETTLDVKAASGVNKEGQLSLKVTEGIVTSGPVVNVS